MQTDRVLSCPPDACMFFNCPGHESRFKGVFGCRIDAVSAAVDTPFALEFAVPDSQTPPNIATVQRLIVVVSPCGAEEIYCADLADPQQPPGSGHACGTTDCESRAAILALQPSEPVAPSLTFSSAVPLISVSEVQASTSPVPDQGEEQQNLSKVLAGLFILSILLLPGMLCC